MRIARVVAAVLMFSVAGSAIAQATYVYTGQPFDTFSAGSNPYSSANSVTGSFTVDSVLADGIYNFSTISLSSSPVNFAMTFADGVGPIYTFDSSGIQTGYPYFFDIVIAGSNVVSWAISVSGSSGSPGGTGHALSSSGGTLVGAHGISPGDVGVLLSARGETRQIGSWNSPPVVAAIPEPEIYAMMLAGLGLLGWVGRRKKLKERAAA